MNLIVGIDPGTTTGIAILDLKGELISLTSSRKYSVANVIKEITRHGNPLIIGADISKIPRFVQSVASKFNEAVLVSPKTDLRKREKDRLVQDYDVRFENVHEHDALAAASHAYKKYKRMINKVKRKVDNRVFQPLIREIILRKVNNIEKGIRKHLHKKP
jgi:predicted RNase H-like nuclease (RuvC/YqgF family)